MRTRRAALSFGSGIAQSAVSMLIGLVVTPYVLRWLGVERFGAFRTLIDWIAYFGILEMGIYGSLLARLAGAAGKNDAEAEAGYLAAGMSFYIRIAIASGLIALVLVPVIPSLIPVEPLFKSDLRTAYILLILTLLFMVIQPFRAYFEATQRSYVVQAASLVRVLLFSGFALWLAHAGAGISGQSLATVIALFGFYLVLVGAFALDRKRFNGKPKLSAARDPRYRSGLFQLQWPTFVCELCGRICLMSDNIVIGLILGPAAVSPFALTQRLYSIAANQLQGVGNATWAAFGELHAQGESQAFRERLVEVTKILALLSGAAAVAIFAVNSRFLALWVGKGLYGGALLDASAAINAFLLPILGLWGWVFTGTGKIRELVPVFAIQAAVNLSASLGLTFGLGLAGPVLGTTAGYLAIPLWLLPLKLKSTFGLSPSALLFPVALQCLIALVTGYFLRSALPLDRLGWAGTIAAAALIGASYLALAQFVALDSEERKGIWRRLAGALRGR